MTKLLTQRELIAFVWGWIFGLIISYFGIHFGNIHVSVIGGWLLGMAWMPVTLVLINRHYGHY